MPEIGLSGDKNALPYLRREIPQNIVPNTNTQTRGIHPLSQIRSIYPPLDSHDKIRILVLHPGKSTDPIRCSLEVVLLKHDDIEYEALSYVWGTGKADQEIWLSEHKFRVRDNLYHALCRIRGRKDLRKLWIDAICINQEDIAERNQQILHMTDIYTRATQVLIWLGREKMYEIVLGSGTQFLNSTRRNSSILFLFENPWFERAWIFQEIVCSKAASLYFGSDEGVPPIRNSLPWSSLGRLYHVAGETDLLRSVPSGQYSKLGPLFYGQLHYNNGQGKNNIQLLSLLELRRDSKATDPRDKVFSLLGLSIEGQENFRADYNLSLAEVYTTVARLLIKSRNDLRLLSAVQHPAGTPNLPSWIPDWQEPWHPLHQDALEMPDSVGNAEGRNIAPKIRSLANPNASNSRLASTDGIGNPQTPFAAATSRPLRLHTDDDPTRLSLDGQSFSKVKILLDFVTDILEIGSTHKHKIAHLVDTGLPLDTRYPGSQGTYLDALFWTATIGLNLEKKSMPQFESFEGLINLAKMRKETQGMTTCKRIFLSENGYIGLVPVGTNIGDEICLLFGGSVPFIVRNQDSYQRFIGECYCHGLMQGEVLENSDEKDIKTYIFY
ncbi:hypothetical protein CJF30_00004958 [Rutstroemia sp. NJR-2017a BBW]|nr:hypothetical protein CJF30_00004958 [Rutstroemia sp. NJR-2017a BBW]